MAAAIAQRRGMPRKTASGLLPMIATSGPAAMKMPIATPVSSVRRLSDCAGCAGRSRDAVPLRTSTRAVISRSTRSRKDSITASLYSGPSSSCVSATARISWGENGDVLLGQNPPVQPRPRFRKTRYISERSLSVAESSSRGWRIVGPSRPAAHRESAHRQRGREPQGTDGQNGSRQRTCRADLPAFIR
jgi:hypothetical protein